MWGELRELRERMNEICTMFTHLQAVPGSLHLTNPTTVSTFSTGAHSGSTYEILSSMRKWLLDEEAGNEYGGLEATLVAAENHIKTRPFPGKTRADQLKKNL